MAGEEVLVWAVLVAVAWGCEESRREQTLRAILLCLQCVHMHSDVYVCAYVSHYLFVCIPWRGRGRGRRLP